MDHIGGLIDDLKEKAGKLDDAKEIYDQISALEKKRDELQKDLAQSQVQSYERRVQQRKALLRQPKAPPLLRRKTALKEDIRSLIGDVEALMKEIERE